MSEQIVTVRNRAGQALHCILESPAGSARDVACLLLSPGVKMRVAPHRLYRKLAPEFLARGIRVMRVDFHGLGDSEGELPETQLDQLYRQVQLGRHVDDAVAAMDYLQKKYGVRRFLIGGLCGGALTGLLAAEQDRRVVGLFALGIPVTLDGTGAHESAHMTRGQLASMRSRYFSKLLRPDAWKRFFSFRSDYRLALASFTALLRQKFLRKGDGQASSDVPAPASAPAANLNPRFPRAFFRLLRRRLPMLLVWSGADRLHWEYQEKFAEPWAEALRPHGELVTTVVVPNANHVLSLPEWTACARSHTAAWLDGGIA